MIAADTGSVFRASSSFTTIPPRCRTAPSHRRVLHADFAQQFGASGYVGRASGRNFDARKMPGYAPYDGLDFTVPVLTAGDVNARVWVRIREVEQSMALIEQIIERLPAGSIATTLDGGGGGEGLGFAEVSAAMCWSRCG